MATGDPTPAKDDWLSRVLSVDLGSATPAITSEGELRAAAARLAAEVQKLAAASPQGAAQLAPGLARLREQLAAKDSTAAIATLRALAAGIDAAAAPEAPTAAPPQPPAAAAREHWQAARSTAVASLRAVLARIDGAAGHAGANKAALRLRSVIKSLARDPASPAEVDELQRWLESDDVIEKVERPNGFGIAVLVRAPLLKALRELKPQLGS